MAIRISCFLSALLSNVASFLCGFFVQQTLFFMNTQLSRLTRFIHNSVLEFGCESDWVELEFDLFLLSYFLSLFFLASSDLHCPGLFFQFSTFLFVDFSFHLLLLSLLEIKLTIS